MASYSLFTDHYLLRIASVCNRELTIEHRKYARYTITDHLTSHMDVTGMPIYKCLQA